jgi:hypothetical protein
VPEVNFLVKKGLTVPKASAFTPAIIFDASDPNTGIYSPGADQVAISTNGTGRLFVDASGNVGVGTSSPAPAIGNGATLHLYGASTTSELRLQRGNGTDLSLLAGSAAGGAAISLNNKFSISTDSNSTQAFTVDTSGRVGIGLTSPATTLDVNGDVTIADKIIHGGDTNTAIRFPAADTVSVETAGSERARIDSSGRLLVGTSTSASTGCALQVRSDNGLNAELFRSSADGGAPYLILSKSRGTAASPALVSSGDTVGYQSYRAYDGSAYIEAARILAEVDGTPGANDMPGRLVFSTTADGASSPTERMRISNAGNVGINATPSTSYRLLAKTSSAIESALGTQGVTGDTATQSILVTKFDNDTTTAQNFIQFQVNNGGANCGRITANGANTAAFGSTSDIRLKENIEDLPPQLENILGLRPVEFDYIESEGGGHQIGFIAQEMQQIYPDVVNERGEDDMLMITGWSKTEARLVKALQEAVAKIETLEAKVAALEGA